MVRRSACCAAEVMESASSRIITLCLIEVGYRIMV